MKEAVDSEDGKLWKEPMVDEMASLHKNEAWDLVELSSGRKPWQQMGVQEEDKCKRKCEEIQSSVGSKSLFLGAEN